MTSTMSAREFSAFPTGTLCNAHADVRAMGATIRPLVAGTRLAGPARTARVQPGQNRAIHRAAHAARAGDVLVVDGGASRSFGPFGDILATGCITRGIAGLVIDSTVRDTAEIKALGFPVFCLGANPTATGKSEPGAVDIEITCGDVIVRPGDLIVGDDDGVVVIPRAIIGLVGERVKGIALSEERLVREIKAGASTLEALGLDHDDELGPQDAL